MPREQRDIFHGALKGVATWPKNDHIWISYLEFLPTKRRGMASDFAKETLPSCIADQFWSPVASSHQWIKPFKYGNTWLKAKSRCFAMQVVEPLLIVLDKCACPIGAAKHVSNPCHVFP